MGGWGRPPPGATRCSGAPSPHSLLTAPPTRRGTEPRAYNGGDVAPRSAHQQRTARSAQQRAPPKTEPTTAATRLHSLERRPAAGAQRPTRRRQAAEHDHGRKTRARRAESQGKTEPQRDTNAATERGGDGARERRNTRNAAKTRARRAQRQLREAGER